MPTSNTYQLSRATWLVDWENAPRDTGYQIEWAECDPERVDNNGNKYVPDGTVMALMAGGKVVPRVDVLLQAEVGYEGDLTGDEEAIGLLIGEANEADRSDALTGYGVLLGGVVYENLLPDAEHADFDTWKTELAANAMPFLFREHVNSVAG